LIDPVADVAGDEQAGLTRLEERGRPCERQCGLPLVSRSRRVTRNPRELDERGEFYFASTQFCFSALKPA
jgi:hypothetical protein